MVLREREQEKCENVKKGKRRGERFATLKYSTGFSNDTLVQGDLLQ